MFNLPLGTTLLVFGFPAFWVLYTIVFLYASRRWGHGPDGRSRP